MKWKAARSRRSRENKSSPRLSDDSVSYQRITKYNLDMTDEALLERIVSNPKVMVGKPVIRGTRLTVEFIVNLLAHGATHEEILGEYEGLSEDDIRACLLF